MATEIINIFARAADQAGVARRLRELHPPVAIDGPDHDWRTATVTFGRLWSKRRLTFTYDPEYHARSNWVAQMSGMSGFLQRFPESGRKQIAVALPTTFRYSIAAFLEPALAGGEDPRFGVLTAVARHLDGVLFTPAGLRDAHGRVLFSAGGEAYEDPNAVWPRVVAQVSAEADDEEVDEPSPPAAERVSRRALALAALTARAVLEDDPRARGAAERHRELLEWVREIGIEDELEGPDPDWPDEPNERSILAAPPGKLDPRSHVNTSWRAEGLAVLAWALGRYDLPPHDQPAKVEDLWEAVGHLRADRARELLASPVLRPREEIGALRGRLFALHWRLRDYFVRPERMDFAEFARTSWFGPLDIAGLPLAKGDLALGGKPIDQADPRVFADAHSAAQERHLAVNWLSEGPRLYSEADTST
jgi:hypothetical protein